MKYCFGVDIGGTTVKMGLFEATGTILEKWEIKTHTEEEGKAILPDVEMCIRDRIGALITNVALKNIIARIRPYEVVEGLKLLICLLYTSFVDGFFSYQMLEEDLHCDYEGKGL